MPGPLNPLSSMSSLSDGLGGSGSGSGSGFTVVFDGLSVLFELLESEEPVLSFDLPALLLSVVLL